MTSVGIGELGEDVRKLLERIRHGNGRAVITDGDEPVGVLYAIDSDDLADHALAADPETARASAEADEELKTGRTTSLESLLEELG